MSTPTTTSAQDWIPEQPHHRLARTIEAGLTTVDDMAKELGCHRNTVLNYINGRTTPRAPVFAVWALRTGVSRQWLLTGDVGEQGERLSRCTGASRLAA